MTKSQTEQPVNIMYCEGNTDGTVGGSFFSLLFLVSGLDRSKFNPIVVFHKEHALLPKYREAGIQTIIVERPTPIFIDKPENRFLSLFYPMIKLCQKGINFIKFFPVTGMHYALLMRKYNIKLLHLNNSIVKNNDWMLAAKLTGVKCITHERGINRFYPRMARYFADQLDAIICISDAVKKVLTDNNINSNNLYTIYNGIDPNIVRVTTPADEILNLHQTSRDKVVIGVIGNIKEWKGQEIAIRSMPMVLEKYPNTVCYLVGDTSIDDQYYKNRLIKLLKELDIENCVIFTGYTNNVANYMNVMRVVLHTSVAPEPFGRVLIEAMSMKKPLIGSRAGAVPEIIQEGITGYTFNPGDSDELATKILRILDDSSLAESMGNNGYKTVNDKFNIIHNVHATQDLYQQILNTG